MHTVDKHVVGSVFAKQLFVEGSHQYAQAPHQERGDDKHQEHLPPLKGHERKVEVIHGVVEHLGKDAAQQLRAADAPKVVG